jgi:hypothetical protein
MLVLRGYESTYYPSFISIRTSTGVTHLNEPFYLLEYIRYLSKLIPLNLFLSRDP